MKITEINELQEISRKVRIGIVEGVYNAKSGHPGGSLSVADILTVLYFNQMNIDEKNPKSNSRDRLVLSKGHVAPALYSVLAERGYFERDELKNLRKLRRYASRTSRHEKYTRNRYVYRLTSDKDYLLQMEWRLLQN